MFDAKFTAKQVVISPGDTKNFEIEVEDADIDDALDEININDVVEHYGDSDLLDKITKEAAMKHFGLQEKE